MDGDVDGAQEGCEETEGELIVGVFDNKETGWREDGLVEGKTEIVGLSDKVGATLGDSIRISDGLEEVAGDLVKAGI
jgi:hypothetical protein